MRPRHCPVRLAIAFGAYFALSASALATPYSEPDYVAALIRGEANRLATFNAVEWDANVAKLATELKESRNFAEALLRIARDEKTPHPPVPPGGLTRDQMRQELEKISQPLESTYIRSHVFRAHYMFAFASQLSQFCTFLPGDKQGEVARAHKAALDWIAAGNNPGPSTQSRSAAMKSGAEQLRRAIANGEQDAASFFKTSNCTSASMRAVTGTLDTLFSANPARIGAPSASISEVSLAMTMRQDDDFIVNNVFLRGSGGDGPYDTVSKSAHSHETYWIPTIADEVVDRTIGWHFDLTGFHAAKADGKPVFLILTSTSARCRECRDLIFDLLLSQNFNKLAGRFHATLLARSDAPNGLFDSARDAFAPETLPAVYLLRVGDETTPAKVLVKQVLTAPSDQLVKLLEPHIGAPVARKQASANAARHELATDLPPFCWKIESYELCQARLRRDGHQE